jgi:hypothetical protein
MTNRKDLKAYIRFDVQGRAIAGSMIWRKKKPAGRFKELIDPASYGCCTPTTTTTTAPPL